VFPLWRINKFIMYMEIIQASCTKLRE
jgi:hypothetical protein